MIDFTFKLKQYLPFELSVCIGESGADIFKAYDRAKYKALEFFRHNYVFEKNCDERFVLNHINLNDFKLVDISSYGLTGIDLKPIFEREVDK